MHEGYAAGLVATVATFLIGVLCSLVFLVSVIASKRHSIFGIKGITLYLMVTAFLLTVALALDNMLWDLLHSRIDLINITICSIVSYFVPMPFLRKLYLNENKRLINKALIICTSLLAALLAVWFVVEGFEELTYGGL
jgi:hypothetical protein